MSTSDSGYSDMFPFSDEGHVQRLAIVIPVYNEVRYTVELLTDLYTYTVAPYDILVIDNASTDETPEYLASLAAVRPSIHVVTNKQNVGVYPAWNFGMRWAVQRGYEHVVVLNNDIRVREGWDIGMLAVFETSPKAFYVCPRFTCAPKIPQDFITRVRSRLGKPLSSSKVRSTEAVGTDFIGFCFMVSKECVEEIGYFDEQFSLWFSDTDYCRRLLASGHPPLVAENVLIHHYLSRTLSKVPNRSALTSKDERLYREKWRAETHR